MKKLSCFFSVLFLMLISCSKSSELFLYVKALEFDWKTESVDGNSLIRLNVFAESQSSVVTRAVIQTYTPDGQNVTVIDTFLTSPVKKLDMDVPYTTPCFSELTKVEARTTVWDQNGATCKFTMIMRVNPSETEIATYDSKTLYSAASLGASAFSWDNMEPFYRDTTAQEGLSFYDDLSEDTITLSCSWSSSTLLFARFEGFNYAQATMQSITEAYKNCSPTNCIRHIHDDDVILIGNSSGALGAIKVLLVSDKEGTEQDRYVFSIKAIK